MLSRIVYCCVALLLVLVFQHPASAQDYDIQRYDLNVQLQPATNSAQVQAKLSLINNTTQGRSGQFVTLKINKRAKVSAVQVDGASAQFQQKEDARLTELAN